MDRKMWTGIPLCLLLAIVSNFPAESSKPDAKLTAHPTAKPIMKPTDLPTNQSTARLTAQKTQQPKNHHQSSSDLNHRATNVFWTGQHPNAILRPRNLPKPNHPGEINVRKTATWVRDKQRQRRSAKRFRLSSYRRYVRPATPPPIRWEPPPAWLERPVRPLVAATANNGRTSNATAGRMNRNSSSADSLRMRDRFAEVLRQMMLKRNETQKKETETIKVHITKLGTNQTSGTKDNGTNSTVHNSTSSTTRKDSTLGSEIRTMKYFPQGSTPRHWTTESHEVSPRSYYKRRQAVGISPTTIIPILAAVASLCFCTLELFGKPRSGKREQQEAPEARLSTGQSAPPSGGPGRDPDDVPGSAVAA